MKCPSCKREWKTEPKTAAPIRCPFCAAVLKPHKMPPEKESFFFTWGMIFEENLKRAGKNALASDFTGALDNYSRALLENPADAIRVADFISRYPQFEKEALDAFPVPEDFMSAHPEIPSFEKLIIRLYLQGIYAKAPQAPLKLANYLESACQDADKTLSLLQELIYSGESWKEDPENFATINVKTALLQKEYKTAIRLLLSLLHAENARFTAISPVLFYELTGLDPNLAKRRQQIRMAAAAGKSERMIQGFVRPLQDSQHKFDQLQEIDDEVLEYIRKNSQEVLSLLTKMVSREIALSGIHLFVNQLDRMKILPEGFFDELLELHYQKVYMKPYSWIEQTDYVVDPDFIE